MIVRMIRAATVAISNGDREVTFGGTCISCITRCDTPSVESMTEFFSTGKMKGVQCRNERKRGIE